MPLSVTPRCEEQTRLWLLCVKTKASLTWFLFGPPQDYQFYIQNFTALQLGTVVPAGRQATFEYSFIPAEPMGGRPFGLVINLNYKDSSVRRWVVPTMQCVGRPVAQTGNFSK